ncbi:GNAT family N-acetyltransferase [Tautonia marina]|uniref:GNAT family N-acetyltransferase n=1 Tax=Tautonia marina TaxID=2653855 RepID=UPI001261395F|nr:GNAT family N-acetyltransferase [Tautonia marina]
MRFPRVPAVSWGRSSEGRLFGPHKSYEGRSEQHTHNRPGFEFRLRDGRRVFLSPVLPEDRHRLEAGFEQLSDQSRVFRFFRQRDQLSEAEIRQLIQVDQVDHVAWCALDLPDPPFDGLGSGRMIRDETDPQSAEVAITVIDAAQRHGLGTVLLALLVLRARMLGIKRLKAFVLPENTVVLQWLRSLGWTVVRDEDSLELEVSTVPESLQAPVSLARQRFHRLLEEMEPLLSECLDAMAQFRPSDTPGPIRDVSENKDSTPESGESV